MARQKIGKTKSNLPKDLPVTKPTTPYIQPEVPIPEAIKKYKTSTIMGELTGGTKRTVPAYEGTMLSGGKRALGTSPIPKKPVSTIMSGGLTSKGTAQAANQAWHELQTSKLPDIKGVTSRTLKSFDTRIANNISQFGSNVGKLANTSTPLLNTIGTGLKFANKALPVVNLGLESMSAASDISANPQMDTLDKISRYSEAAGNSFGIPFPEMANSTVNMLTGMDQETASQKLAREAGDKTNYQYAVGAMSEADANNLATGQDEYTRNHLTYPSQMINRNNNTSQQPSVSNGKLVAGTVMSDQAGSIKNGVYDPQTLNLGNVLGEAKPTNTIPEMDYSLTANKTNPYDVSLPTQQTLNQQPKPNISGEQVASDVTKSTGVKGISSYTDPATNMITYGKTGFTPNQEGTILNNGSEGRTTINGKVDRNSEWFKRNDAIAHPSRINANDGGIQYNTGNPTSVSVDFNAMQSKPTMYQGEVVQSKKKKDEIQNQYSQDALSWQDKLKFEASQNPFLRRY